MEAAGALKTPPDLTSILQQVQALQAEKERLQKELEDTKGVNVKLQAGKREEMQKALDTLIQKWLADSVANEEVRKEFQEGCARMADKANECGVWTVACQASALHAKQLEELERLRAECDSLRANPGGQFKDEAARKRGREEPAKNDFWGEFKVDYQ